MAAPAKQPAKPQGKAPTKGTNSARYKLYEKKGNTITRKNQFCPKCGPGSFMANHKDRRTCGKCGYMEKK